MQNPLGQVDILFKHFQGVQQLVDIQVLTGYHETHLLTILLPVEFHHFLIHLPQLNGTGNSTTGINDLTHFQDKVIAVFRDIDIHQVREITICENAASIVAERQACLNVRQPLRACQRRIFIRYCLGSIVNPDTFIVLIRKVIQLLQRVDLSLCMECFRECEGHSDDEQPE